MQKTLILIKPDALQRNLLGEIISRFEKKGLKIVGLKMIQLTDEQLIDHYAHHKDKPFFKPLCDFMKSSPVVAMVLEGVDVIEAVRLIVGPTLGREADAGSIRGDFSMSQSYNIVHASDSAENAEKEVWRFFNEDEIYNYQKMDFVSIYNPEELLK